MLDIPSLFASHTRFGRKSKPPSRIRCAFNSEKLSPPSPVTPRHPKEPYGIAVLHLQDSVGFPGWCASQGILEPLEPDSICLSMCVCVCLFVCLCVYVCLCVCLSLSICLPISLSLYICLPPLLPPSSLSLSPPPPPSPLSLSLSLSTSPPPLSPTCSPPPHHVPPHCCLVFTNHGTLRLINW